MDELDEAYLKIEPKGQERIKISSFKLRRIAYAFFIIYFSTLCCFFIFPIMTMLKIKNSTGEWGFLYPLVSISQPKLLLLNLFLRSYCWTGSMFAAASFDMLYLMILAQVVAQYRLKVSIHSFNWRHQRIHWIQKDTPWKIQAAGWAAIEVERPMRWIEWHFRSSSLSSSYYNFADNLRLWICSRYAKRSDYLGSVLERHINELAP